MSLKLEEEADFFAHGVYWKEKYEELLSQVGEKESELEYIKNMDPKDMYKEDLNELKKVLKKEYN